MRINDFSNKELIECIKLLVTPYKKKGSIESLSPIEINEIHRTDSSVSITTSQLFANKYLLNRVYKFSDTKKDKIKVEIIEHCGNDTIITDLSDKIRPFLAMITKDDNLKGKDWLSRLNYEDYLYLINKYHKKVASLTFESNEQSPEHCRRVSLNDENGYYLGVDIVFGDYGLGYNHYGKLSKFGKTCVFDAESLEFYHIILKKLNDSDKIEYTLQFIATNISAFKTSNSTKDYYEEQLEAGNMLAQKLIKEVNNVKLPH